MRTISAGLVIFLSACTHAPATQPGLYVPPQLTNEQLVGTWASGSLGKEPGIYEEWSFLADGTYCSATISTYKTNNVFSFSRGKWRLQNNVIEIGSLVSSNPEQSLSPSLSVDYEVKWFNASNIHLYDGCDHCSGPINYQRTSVDRGTQVCDAWCPTTQSRGPP
jgi:hypothetical protein